MCPPLEIRVGAVQKAETREFCRIGLCVVALEQGVESALYFQDNAQVVSMIDCTITFLYVARNDVERVSTDISARPHDVGRVSPDDTICR